MCISPCAPGHTLLVLHLAVYTYLVLHSAVVKTRTFLALLISPVMSPAYGILDTGRYRLHPSPTGKELCQHFFSELLQGFSYQWSNITLKLYTAQTAQAVLHVHISWRTQSLAESHYLLSDSENWITKIRQLEDLKPMYTLFCKV